MGIDHQKLKTMNLLLLSLVTSLVILGFIYLNELSRRIQLQQEIVMLERQSQQLVDERSVIQHKKTKELEKQTNEINKMQSTHEFQIQQQSTNFWTEKNNLLQTISSKDKIIQDQKYQYDALKQRFEILNSEMEQFEKNQSRLLEKFSTQSTQCMNVINMMKELCDEKKSNRKKSKSTQEKEIAGVTMGLQSSHVIKQTQFISLTSSSSRLHNTTQKPDIHVEVTQGRRTSTELYRDSGNTEYVPTKDTLTTITETLTSLTANAKENKMFDVQEVQTLESENEKIKNIRNVDITESKEELDYQENIMDNPKKETKSKPEKENTLKSERIKALEAGDKFALSEQDAQKEETVIEKISYHENITEIDGKLEQQRKTIHRPKYQKALSLNPTLQSIRKSYKAKDTKSKLEDVEQEGNENKLATLKNESLKLTDKNRTGKNKNIFEKGEDEYQEIESIISSENEKFLEESQLNSENTTEQKKEKLDILTN